MIKLTVKEIAVKPGSKLADLKKQAEKYFLTDWDLDSDSLPVKMDKNNQKVFYQGINVKFYQIDYDSNSSLEKSAKERFDALVAKEPDTLRRWFCNHEENEYRLEVDLGCKSGDKFDGYNMTLKSSFVVLI